MALQRTGVVPKLYAAWTCGKSAYFVIEKLEKCKLTKNNIFIQVKEGIKKIHRAGWFHNDSHDGNIMCRRKKNGDSEVVFIDFGLASKVGERLPRNHFLRQFCATPPEKDIKVREDVMIQKYFNPQTTKEQKEEYRKVFDKFSQTCF